MSYFEHFILFDVFLLIRKLKILEIPLFVDPMGEKHNTRRTPWIPTFLVVVSFIWLYCNVRA